MKKRETQGGARALSSTDGKQWQDGTTVAWPDRPDPSVTKLVLGSLEKREEGAVQIDAAFLKGLGTGLAEAYPNLTHLHLWGLAGLRRLGGLPAGLRCLDVRRCADLAEVEALPADDLEELIIEAAPALGRLPLSGDCPRLRELSLNGCSQVSERDVQALLQGARELNRIDLSGLGSLTEMAEWPQKLERADLNDCPQLVRLSSEWPTGRYAGGAEDPALLPFHRLGLRNCGAVAELPDLPASLDYIDLRGTKSLRKVPRFLGRPRTLFIQGSGLELPGELFGDTEDFNAADRVLAHLAEKERVVDDEVKVILLGDGRAGKTSLMRALVDGDFDRYENSTHGIRLWDFELPFRPQGEEATPATVRLHVWDFAGQDLYHNTHRLFLQNRAIFLICGNCCPDGADPETDRSDSDHLEPEEDVRHGLRYWRDQVAALGTAPGMETRPPVLVVRTKADRDAEGKGYAEAFARRRVETVPELECLDVSARNGKNLDGLRDWLSAKAAEVLGPRGKREIGVNPLKVKLRLKHWIDRNNQAHAAAEDNGKPPRPPFPTMKRSGEEGFDALVRRLCPEGDYYERPGLLLERFHLAGFLYYSSEFLPDTIILDQRWVIRGMYAAFDREHAWPALKGSRGCFTRPELETWSWGGLGYTAEEQQLFLKFMESCGMAFALGPDRAGEMEYLAPAALPFAGERTEREAEDYRAGLEAGEPVILRDPSLSRDAVAQLLVRLGREWRRAPVLWRWGGQFQSYRRHVWHWEGPLTFAHLNWQPETEESYGGTLTLTPYGPDRSFLNAILNECQEIRGFRQVELPRLPLPAEERIPRGEAAPSHAPADDAAAHRFPVHAEVVEIGLSFAGDQPRRVPKVEDLPEGSIEKWPLELAAALRRMNFKVIDYRDEQSQASYQQTPGRREFLDKVASRDYVVAFLSWAYLESPWCMYEFLKIYERMNDGRHDPSQAGFACFPEAHFSQTDLRQTYPASGKSPLSHFREHWEEWLRLLNERIEADAKKGDAVDHERLLQGYGYADWARCVDDTGRFTGVWRAVQGEWAIRQVGVTPDKATLNEWCQDIARNTGQAEMLKRYAVSAFQAGDRDRACRCFVRASEYESDGQLADLAEVLGRRIPPPADPVLNDVRLQVRERYEELTKDGHRVQNWSELAACLKPRDDDGV